MSKELEEALTRMNDLYCAICPHKKGDCNECEYNQKSNIVYQALIKAQETETQNNMLKEVLRNLIKVDDSDLSHLKIKVNFANVAVNQDSLKWLKGVLEDE